MSTSRAAMPGTKGTRRRAERRAAGPYVLVSNETPRRICIEGLRGSFTLAPLERRVMPEKLSPERVFPATYRQLRDRRQLSVEQASSRHATGIVGDAAGGALHRVRQTALLLTALGVGVVLPALAMYYGTEVHRIVTIGGRHRVSVINSADTSTVLTGRALQLAVIAVGALLPALMYFQFDRDKLSALRARWLRQVFRLDGDVETVSDVRAKYGNQLDEVFGRRGGPPSSPQLGAPPPVGRLSPIMVCTLVLSVGWSLILMNSSVVSDARLLGVPGGEQIHSVSFLHLFTPEPSTLMFGFLGAYFFGVQLVLRGYVRGDLRPKAYNGITVRVIITLILAWLLQAVAGEHAVTWVLAFLTGVVPETAVQWIRDSLPDRPKGMRPSTDDETAEALDLLKGSAPLTDLEGVDLYDRARLADEGITNVQALAHHSLVDLMLNTRIPAARLIDWVDQAILYLHVAGSTEEGRARLAHLHQQGIRTATQLIGAASAGPAAAELLQGDATHPPDLGVLVAAMQHDEWLPAVTRWRGGNTTRPPLEITDLSGPVAAAAAVPPPSATAEGSPLPVEGLPHPVEGTDPRSPAR